LLFLLLSSYLLLLTSHLHPAQDDDVHPPQPEPPPEPDDDLPVPNFDSRFSVFREPHFGQRTSGLDPKTSCSKHSLQAEH
jgi:hypothetical protein